MVTAKHTYDLVVNYSKNTNDVIKYTQNFKIYISDKTIKSEGTLGSFRIISNPYNTDNEQEFLKLITYENFKFTDYLNPDYTKDKYYDVPKTIDNTIANLRNYLKDKVDDTTLDVELNYIEKELFRYTRGKNIDDYYYAFINFMNMYKLSEYMDNYMDLNILSCYALKDLEELNILNDMFSKEVKPWLIENVNL